MSLDRTAMMEKAKKRTYETVPTCIGPVRIQSLTEWERNEIEAELYDAETGKAKDDAKSLRAHHIVRAVVDDDGALQFVPGDVPDIMQWNSGVTLPLYAAIKKMSEGQPLPDAVKNSEAAPGNSQPVA